MRKVLYLYSALVSVSPAMAEAITGQAELGFVATTGNTETQLLNAKVKLFMETDTWLHTGKLAAYNSSNTDQTTGQDETTAEKYSGEIKSDRNLDDRQYLYGLGNYDKDRFSGFDYQAALGAGYGYKVIVSDVAKLTLEAGPGYRINAIENGAKEDELTLRLAEAYMLKFSDTAQFDQYLTVESGDYNTIAKLGASVQSALSKALALKVGIDIKYTDKVPLGLDDTDTETYASVLYNF